MKVYHPEELTIRQRYELMAAGIAPRPIALVSTISPDGVPNLAPFSFFTGLGAEPMTLVFCPANGRDGREKDTLANCKPVGEGGTGQFVVNVVVEGNVEGAVAAAENLPPEVNEFESSGLQAESSVKVRPPRVASSPLAFECETLQVIRMKPGVPGGANLVIGRIVLVHAEDGLYDEDFQVEAGRLPLVGRLGGREYLRVHDRFTLPRS